MVTTDIKEIYDDIKDYVTDDTSLTKSYMYRINSRFYSYLKNPTSEKEETFKRFRDALIIMWLAELFKRATKQAFKQIAIGIKFGNQAIKRAKIKRIINKTINSNRIKQMIQAHVDKAITEMTYVSNGIKVNSDRAISDIKSNFDKTKKVISTELMAEYSDYGITYYEDKLGRRQDLSQYVNRKVSNLLVNVFRDTYIAEMVRNGIEYAVVRRLPTTAIECQNCIAYDNKILAFYDNDLGYETVAEARLNNLFHYGCYHYLEPIVELDEDKKEIKHTEENKKSRKRYVKNGVKFGLFS